MCGRKVLIVLFMWNSSQHAAFSRLWFPMWQYRINVRRFTSSALVWQDNICIGYALLKKAKRPIIFHRPWNCRIFLKGPFFVKLLRTLFRFIARRKWNVWKELRFLEQFSVKNSTLSRTSRIHLGFTFHTF